MALRKFERFFSFVLIGFRNILTQKLEAMFIFFFETFSDAKGESHVCFYSNLARGRT